MMDGRDSTLLQEEMRLKSTFVTVWIDYHQRESIALLGKLLDMLPRCRADQNLATKTQSHEGTKKIDVNRGHRSCWLCLRDFVSL